MKRAFVTGSTRGVGRGIAGSLVAAGYVVYINGRDAEQVATVAAELGENAIPAAGDMQSPEGIRELLERAWSDGPLDLVVSNIGTGKGTPGAQISEEERRRLFEINFFGPTAVAERALELFGDRGGHFVFISSIAGMEVLGAPAAYSSAKGALAAYARNLAVAGGPKHRVNVVSPGNVMFPGSTWDTKMQKDTEGTQSYIKSNVPLNRFAAPEEIGEAVLALERMAFATGCNLVLDGGQLRAL